MMQEHFSIFNMVSSFLYALLFLCGICSWSVIGVLKLFELLKGKKDKNVTDAGQ